MTKERDIEIKAFSAITAICSSILTNLCSDLVLETSYSVQKRNEKLIIKAVQTPLVDSICSFLKLIGVFLIIWLLLTFLVYIITGIYKKVHVRKLSKINEKDLAAVLADIKKRSRILYDEIYAAHDDLSKEYFIKMNIKELAFIIQQLYNHFSRPNKEGQQNLKKVCRDSATSGFASIINGISYYELQGTFELLRSIIDEAKKIKVSDELFENDCGHLNDLLNGLELIFSLDERQS